MTGLMWAVDVEGNGASPPEIIELALVEIEGLDLTGRHKLWRFKPKQPISPMTSRIHGIWNRDVADAPEIEDVADDLIELMGNTPIVGHNVRVEHEILKRVLIDWEPSAAYDTLRIAKRLLPGQEKYGLERLGSLLELDVEAGERSEGRAAHSALYDAVLCGLLLRKLLDPIVGPERQKLLQEADILRGVQGSLL